MDPKLVKRTVTDQFGPKTSETNRKRSIWTRGLTLGPIFLSRIPQVLKLICFFSTTSAFSKLIVLAINNWWSIPYFDCVLFHHLKLNWFWLELSFTRRASRIILDGINFYFDRCHDRNNLYNTSGNYFKHPEIPRESLFWNIKKSALNMSVIGGNTRIWKKVDQAVSKQRHHVETHLWVDQSQARVWIINDSHQHLVTKITKYQNLEFIDK